RLLEEGAVIARRRGRLVLRTALRIAERTAARSVPVGSAALPATGEIGAEKTIRFAAFGAVPARIGAAVGTGKLLMARVLRHFAGAAERPALREAFAAVHGPFIGRGDGIVGLAGGRIVWLDAAAPHARIEIGILVVDEVLGIVLRGSTRKED